MSTGVDAISKMCIWIVKTVGGIFTDVDKNIGIIIEIVGL